MNETCFKQSIRFMENSVNDKKSESSNATRRNPMAEESQHCRRVKMTSSERGLICAAKVKSESCQGDFQGPSALANDTLYDFTPCFTTVSRLR